VIEFTLFFIIHNITWLFAPFVHKNQVKINGCSYAVFFYEDIKMSLPWDCLIVLVTSIFSYVGIVFTSSNSEWHTCYLITLLQFSSYFHSCSNIMGQFHMLEGPFWIIIVWTYGFNYMCGEISMPCDNVTDHKFKC
jgi:hypothetical protein